MCWFFLRFCGVFKDNRRYLFRETDVKPVKQARSRAVICFEGLAAYYFEDSVFLKALFACFRTDSVCF